MVNNLLYFFIPFCLSLILTPIVRTVAYKFGLISYPRADRWHKRPTAILGGVAIYAAVMLSVLLLTRPEINTLGILLGGTFLFVVGLIDDRLHLTPYIKMFTQIIAGSVAVLSGVVIGLPIDDLFAIPLTLFLVVAVTNSFNLLDNIDGLAAGIAAICSLMLFFSSVFFSSNLLAPYALIVGGAALGFLPYNFNPARIFMGDSGSMFLGYSLAVIAISGTTQHISGLFVSLLIPVLILCVPIFDTIFVMIVRTLQGRKIFTGGQDHTSHHLVTLGISPRKTVILLYLISIIAGSIAIFYSKLSLFMVSVITFLVLVILLFFGVFISSELSHNLKKNKINISEINKYTFLNSVLLHKRRFVEVVLDFAFICIAYYSAYFLRFEGNLLSANLYLLRESIIWIILIKMSVFFAFGLYRGVWRYISISDLITVFKVVTLGSLLSIIFLTFAFRFRSYSRAVFFIDWLLLLFLIAGSRILFRILGEFLSLAREKGENILIFGAGDTGEMVVREIKRNKSLNYNAVGFIDDDPAKLGNKIQGLRVLGNRNKIAALVQEHNVKEVLIAMPSLDIEDYAEIVLMCKQCKVRYRKIKGILDYEEKSEFRNN